MIVLASSPLLRDRVLSVFKPQQNVVDSQPTRAALRATGWEMIKAHPLVGVGPEQVKVRFGDYAPPSVPRPFPTEWSIGHLHNVYIQYAAERGLPALGVSLVVSSASALRLRSRPETFKRKSLDLPGGCRHDPGDDGCRPGRAQP